MGVKTNNQKTVEIHSTVSVSIAYIPFNEIAESVLGKNYSLSLLICGDSLARRINKETRKKTYAPNVLSFELEKNVGEIVLNIRKAEREARTFKTTLKNRIILLFVHGCYHLKGHDHSDEMEALEAKTIKRFAA